MTAPQAQGLPAPVAHALQKAGISDVHAGVYVRAIGASELLVGANLERGFNPASTMKLLTTGAALDLLGSTYKWKTDLVTDGNQFGDVLQGNLILQGSGDPKLVIENAWLMLRQLRARGIRTIRGDVVIDRSRFAAAPFDAAAFDGDPLKPYNAGTDALLFNYGAMTLHFMPDPASGQLQVNIDPALEGYRIDPPAQIKGACGDWQARLQPTIANGVVSFSGGYPALCGEKTWAIHPYMLNATDYFGAAFRSLWRELGGVLEGVVRDGVTPVGVQQLVEWQSPALPEVIRDINKYSNNVMASQLLLTLSAETGVLPATFAGGEHAIRSWLASQRVDVSTLVVDNGSGLSRSARVSASTMGDMLNALFMSPAMPEFVSSLPLVGLDGTMRRRLATQSVAGQAHIKTGTLHDASAVAGYVLAASGRYYVVVMLVNDPNAPLAHPAQDALLQWVYTNG